MRETPRRRNNAETQTWKKQAGRKGYRTRLKGNEVWLRSGRRQAGNDLGHSSGSRTRRHILRYRRSVRSIHERRTSGRSSRSLPRQGGDRNEVRLGGESCRGRQVEQLK